MKTNGNQKNLYLLSLIMLITALAIICAWAFTGGGKDAASDAVQTPVPQPVATPAPTVCATDGVYTSAANADPDVQMVSTVVYYQDNYGYLVPVMCNVQYEDGIAKATINRMVQSAENDMQAARLGLKTVLPEGTTIDLDIHEGLARIDLSKEALNLPDAAAESNMIAAIVQALTEFDSVEKVEFLFGGRKMEKLPHGTDVSSAFERGEINLETASQAVGSDKLKALQLYFPCESSSVVVPVTRMVYANADVNTAVLELAKGPSATSPLENTIPAGCGLIDVSMENGVAKVNFTREFAHLVENSDGGRLALKALVLTCTQFEGVKGVEIYVEGEKYDPGENTLSVPTFANVADEIVNDYIHTQSNMIFDFE